MNKDNGIKDNKKTILRSPRFPAYTLEDAINTIIEARKFGKTVSDAQIAGDKSIISGSFIRRKAALGYYGLITGRGNQANITDLAERIVYPKSGEKEKAVKKAFLTPKIFNQLYQGTTKNTPITLSVLGNILIRDYGIQPSSKNFFLSVFIKSGLYAKLIKYTDDTKSEIILLDNTEGSNDTIQENIQKEESQRKVSNVSIPQYNEDNKNNQTQIVELILTNGKAKIYVPKELTPSDAKRLRAQIDILANIFN